VHINVKLNLYKEDSEDCGRARKCVLLQGGLPLFMAFVLTVDDVEPPTPLLFVPQLFCAIQVWHRGFLRVADSRINNRLDFVLGCENSFLGRFNSDCVITWGSPLRLPHVQEIYHGFRLLVKCRRSSLLICGTKFYLLCCRCS